MAAQPGMKLFPCSLVPVLFFICIERRAANTICLQTPGLNAFIAFNKLQILLPACSSKRISTCASFYNVKKQYPQLSFCTSGGIVLLAVWLNRFRVVLLAVWPHRHLSKTSIESFYLLNAAGRGKMVILNRDACCVARRFFCVNK
jgi:hypothetical protein